MKFREVKLKSGNRIFLGRNAENNDELMKKFKGKENVILHTESPGSPFCVIERLNPGREEIKASGAVCARYSQDWRDNKKDVKVNVFTGKDVRKPWFAKKGTWNVRKVKGKGRTIKVKKAEIKKFEKEK